MEVYGVKPKRFTKEWWPYFWDYYKLHLLAVIFAVIVLISALYECKKQIKYDLQIDIITENFVTEEAITSLTEFTKGNIQDVTKNGVTDAYVLYLDMGEEDEPQFMEAMQTKMMVEVGYTEGFVFLVSKKYADYMSEIGVSMPSSDWTEAESYNGYCIDLKGSKILENTGIDTSDLYLGVVAMRERDKEKDRKKNLPKQENGIKIAKLLIDGE